MLKIIKKKTALLSSNKLVKNTPSFFLGTVLVTRDLKNGVSRTGTRRPQTFFGDTLEDVKSNFRPSFFFHFGHNCLKMSFLAIFVNFEIFRILKMIYII